MMKDTEIKKAIIARNRKDRESKPTTYSARSLLFSAVFGALLSTIAFVSYDSRIVQFLPLPSFIAELLTSETTDLSPDIELGTERVAIPLDKAPVCKLGEICASVQERPLLEDGRVSSAVWDKPRFLMRSKFSHTEGAKVSYIWEEPLVVYFDDVLDEDELNYLVDTATPRFERSKVAGPDGVPIPDKTRTSETAWIYMHESETARRIVNKVAKLAGFTAEYAEDIGINKYEKSQEFRPHFDYMQEEQLGANNEFRNCQRSATILIYLSDVESGGETVFMRSGGYEFDANNPDHLSISPKRGRVLVWYSMHPFTERVDDRTLHAGSPVEAGVKIASTVFLRNCTRFENQIQG